MSSSSSSSSFNNNKNKKMKLSSSSHYQKIRMPSATALHAAILANSYEVVSLLLEQGADPNLSPLLPPIGLLSDIKERARDFHRVFCRVFRSTNTNNVDDSSSTRSTRITPLIVGVCNAYHHNNSVSSTTATTQDALNIISVLLRAGANTQDTCIWITLCKIGIHPSLTIAAPKTACQMALFLKRFPNTATSSTASTAISTSNEHKEENNDNDNDNDNDDLDIMDTIATMILQKSQEEGRQAPFFLHGTTSPVPVHCYPSQQEQEQEQEQEQKQEQEELLVPSEVTNGWKKLLENDENDTADFVFVCPDGRVNAHKCVLAAAAPYFKDVLSRNSSSFSDVVQLRTHYSTSILQTLLQFIYTGQLRLLRLPPPKLQDNYDFWKQLLSIASEYQITTLLQHCEQKLITSLFSSSVTSSTAAESCKTVLCLANYYNLQTLKSNCYQYIQHNSLVILTDRNFINLAKEDKLIWQQLTVALSTTKQQQ